ncbi:MAG: DEAD/DEAH box helicase [Flavobacteriia bacterium]|nr:DEAD/DEAH box helicase [Flavobacteriia bacterium]
MKFKDFQLNPNIKEQLSELGFVKPTDIQFKSIPSILNKEDVFAIAYTGTGKTASFVIPSLEMLSRKKQKCNYVHTLCLVPTRELALQIQQVFQEIGKKLPFHSLAITGGVEQEEQIRQLKKGVQIVVSTPGRMFDLIAQKVLDLSKIELLVLDEADVMLDLGFKKDILDLLKKIPKKRQTLFFSATINKKVKALAYDMVKDAIRIQISPKNPVANTIEHEVLFVEMDDKRYFLENILTSYPDFRFLIFVRTKVRAERVQKAMERVQIQSSFLHGGLDQSKRIELLSQFKEGIIKVLISTDVAARGIDIPNVEYVINYDLPDNPENYVHRVGRTGRAGKKGQALSFCSKSEKELLDAIESYTGHSIGLYPLSKEDYSDILEESEDYDKDWRKLIQEHNKNQKNKNEW